MVFLFFFFNDTATTEIYTLSLHDALPIYRADFDLGTRVIAEKVFTSLTPNSPGDGRGHGTFVAGIAAGNARSEEHTSELQSRPHLVCRLLPGKKQNQSLTFRRHRH